MSKKRSKEKLKNIAYLVSRNNTKQEVINVIFPNGLTVGLEDAGFANGLKVNGDTTIGGIVNARDVRVNGTSVSTAAGADGVMCDFTRSVISVDTDNVGGKPGSGGDLADADISDQAFTKIDVNAGTTNVTFAGHNESGDPSSNTYKIVSDSMTATTDNGTSLTEANSASEGDTSYDVTFANSGTRLTLAVSSDSSDAKLKVSSLTEHEDGSSTDFNSILVNVPIKVTTAAGTQTVTRSFTVQKIKAPAAPSAPTATIVSRMRPEVITIPTGPNGGAVVGGGDLLASAGEISDQAFAVVNAVADSTTLIFDGSGTASDSVAANKYRIVDGSVTAVDDNGG